MRPNDFEVNQLVTVVQGRQNEVSVATPFGMEIREIEDRSLNGCLLQVKAINHPYIVVELLRTISGTKPENTPRIVLKISEWKFVKASNEYAIALGHEFPASKILVN